MSAEKKYVVKWFGSPEKMPYRGYDVASAGAEQVDRRELMTKGQAKIVASQAPFAHGNGRRVLLAREFHGEYVLTGKSCGRVWYLKNLDHTGMTQKLEDAYHFPTRAAAKKQLEANRHLYAITKNIVGVPRKAAPVPAPAEPKYMRCVKAHSNMPCKNGDVVEVVGESDLFGTAFLHFKTADGVVHKSWWMSRFEPCAARAKRGFVVRGSSIRPEYLESDESFAGCGLKGLAQAYVFATSAEAFKKVNEFLICNRRVIEVELGPDGKAVREIGPVAPPERWVVRKTDPTVYQSKAAAEEAAKGFGPKMGGNWVAVPAESWVTT